MNQCGQDWIGAWWDVWLVTVLPTRSAAQTTPTTNIMALRSRYTLHGDLMLMATLETAGEPPVLWMARGLSCRFPSHSQPCKENKVCNTRMVQAWGGGMLMSFQFQSRSYSHYVFMRVCLGISDLWKCGVICHTGNSRLAHSQICQLKKAKDSGSEWRETNHPTDRYSKITFF